MTKDLSSTNINRLLKEVKSDISANYICSNNKEIIITTNKIATSSDLNIIEKYVKELNDVDMNDIMISRLSQSKSYFKILSILYFVEDINLPVTLDTIKSVIKSTHIFNNVVLAFRPWVIKASLKSDMAVV